jgi:hypothetical protein
MSIKIMWQIFFEDIISCQNNISSAYLNQIISLVRSWVQVPCTFINTNVQRSWPCVSKWKETKQLALSYYADNKWTEQVMLSIEITETGQGTWSFDYKHLLYYTGRSWQNLLHIQRNFSWAFLIPIDTWEGFQLKVTELVQCSDYKQRKGGNYYRSGTVKAKSPFYIPIKKMCI